MSPEPINVLFCCLGNICRSPMAEAVFRHAVQKQRADDHFNLAAFDGVNVRADEFDAVLSQNALAVELDRGVERGLAAEGGEHRVGTLGRKHPLERDEQTAGQPGEGLAGLTVPGSTVVRVGVTVGESSR